MHLESDNQYDLKEILDNYRNLRSGKPSYYIDEDTFEAIVNYYDGREQLVKALEAAEYATEQFPFSSMLLLKKADLQLASGKYYEALATLDHIETIDTSETFFYILKTEAYLATDQQQKAIELLELALTKFYGDEKIELLFELADVYDDYENFDKIVDCLKLILEIDPTNEEALHKICFWADHTKRNEESVAIHQQILDENPYCVLAWFNLGVAYQSLKLYEKSIDAYKFVLAIDEKFEFAYRNMGDAYMRLRKYRDAIENLEKVLELTKPEEVLCEALGFCYERLKNIGEARFYYRKAIHINQENPRLYNKLASTYMKEQQWSMALKYLHLALKIDAVNVDSNFAKAQCHFQMDELENTLEACRIVLKYKPTHIKSWELAMQAMYWGNELQQGLLVAKVAYSHLDGKIIFNFYEVAFYYALGMVKEAFVLLEMILTKQSKKHVKLLLELEPNMIHHTDFARIMAKYTH